MKMQFKVTYDDGRELESIAKPKDFIAFERQFGKSMGAFANEGEVQIEWIYYLAWSALHRTGVEPGAFDAFLDVVDDVEPVNEETPAAAADPSSPEPMATASAG